MSRTKKSTAVTIEDIARLAGVGVGTVSRVINNNQSVKFATRNKVLAAIEDLNYVPSPPARLMNSRRTKTIGVVIPTLARPFSVEVLRSLVRAVTEVEHELMLYNINKDSRPTFLLDNLALKRRVDGVILVSLSPDERMLNSLWFNS